MSRFQDIVVNGNSGGSFHVFSRSEEPFISLDVLQLGNLWPANASLAFYLTFIITVTASICYPQYMPQNKLLYEPGLRLLVLVLFELFSMLHYLKQVYAEYS